MGSIIAQNFVSHVPFPCVLYFKFPFFSRSILKNRGKVDLNFEKSGENGFRVIFFGWKLDN